VSKPIVIVSAAMSVPSAFYRTLAGAFAEHDWDTHLQPTRGYEKDGAIASRRNDWSYASEAAAIATSVAAARAENPDRPVIVMGHSLGGQLAVMHQLHHEPADGLIAIGASVPHFRHYGRIGAGVLTLGLSVPIAARVFGYVPKPFFGGPGARTMMREWAGFVRSGKPPFAVPHPVPSPTLVIDLKGDTFATVEATDHYVKKFLDADHTSRWTYDTPPDGGNTHHIWWAKTPAPVVEHIVDWWASTNN